MIRIVRRKFSMCYAYSNEEATSQLSKFKYSRIFRKIYNPFIHLELQRNTLARYFLNFLFLEREKKEAREFK